MMGLFGYGEFVRPGDVYVCRAGSQLDIRIWSSQVRPWLEVEIWVTSMTKVVNPGLSPETGLLWW